jgi:hypothetical protein
VIFAISAATDLSMAGLICQFRDHGLDMFGLRQEFVFGIKRIGGGLGTVNSPPSLLDIAARVKALDSDPRVPPSRQVRASPLTLTYQSSVAHRE